jgi:(p)ppGpp synthase/HD superfamily hydrolase
MTQRPVNPSPPEWCTAPIVEKALAFASHAHREQTRKYTGEPYIYHPLHVAQILVDAYPNDPPPDEVLCAALLHDVVEDCGITFTELRREFNDAVAINVLHLTDLVGKDIGNRDTRKMLEAERVRCAPIHCQIIKLADFISNTYSICEHDHDFAVVYLKEKERVLANIQSAWIDLTESGLKIDDNSIALFNRAVSLMEGNKVILRSRP